MSINLSLSRNLRIVAVFLFTLLLVSGGYYRSVSNVPDERKVAVIVLDGGDFKVIDRLTEKGELPNIQKMERNGVRTEYRTPESFSPQGWTKMATGMSTENISLDRSWSYRADTGEQRRLDSNAIEHRRFWSYLNEDGIDTGIYQWLVTWPVEPVDGFMVSAYLAADIYDMTYPESLKIPGDEIRNSLVLFETFDTAQNITREYSGTEVMAYGFHVSDRMQHSFWKYLEGDDPGNRQYRELMYRPYREVDELVGELRPEYTVILVSDHGFERPWTDTYQADMNDMLEKIGLTSYKVSELKMARNRVFDSEAVIAHRHHENDVINGTHYRVRFELMNRDYRPDEVKQELRKIRYPDGERLLNSIDYSDNYFEAVMYLDPEYMSEEYLDERHMRLSYARGDLPILQQNLTLEYGGRRIESKIGPKKTGDHPPGTNGIFYMSGDGIKSRGEADIDIKAEDLAPLILYLKGSEIPEDMDGEVPRELFSRDYALINPPRFEDLEVERDDFDRGEIREEDQDERIKERLGELGYLR